MAQTERRLHRRFFEPVRSTMLCALVLLATAPDRLSTQAASTSSAEVRSRAAQSNHTAKYLRVAGDRLRDETEIRLRHGDDGWAVKSVTQRGRLQLTITAQYDSEQRLREAQVTVREGDDQRTASVTTSNGTARVHRQGEQPADLDCPLDVIVTSAPDWTDTFFAVRRYKSAGPKTQEFQGLWVHPTRPPQRLVFKVTRVGAMDVKRQGETVRLTQLEITLRGGSKYVGYKEPHGELVRLAPADKPRQAIVLAGWERAIADWVQ